MKTKQRIKDRGIYIIFCLLTGLGYIGGSKHLRDRLKTHLDRLRLDKHECPELQKDWNELGSELFDLFPVEFVKDQSDLAARERAWIKKCLIEGKVYNRLNAVRSEHVQDFEKTNPKWPKEPPSPAARNYVFVTPTGLEMPVKGLRGICEAYGLNPSHMSKVARNIYVQHRGWTAKLTD